MLNGFSPGPWGGLFDEKKQRVENLATLSIYSQKVDERIKNCSAIFSPTIERKMYSKDDAQSYRWLTHAGHGVHPGL
jgi:hypothetical protein